MRPDESIDEVKSIGSRYCDDDACVNEDTKANGISRERIEGYHLRRKVDARPCIHRIN